MQTNSLISRYPLTEGSELYSTPLGNILIGCPPEILKVMLNKHVPMPDTIVIPGTLHKFNSSLACLEFPFYHFIFIQQGLARGKRFKIYAKKSICSKLKEMLRVTLVGPSYDEIINVESKLKVPSKLSKQKAKQIVAETEFLAPKDKNGKPYKLKEMVEFISLEIGDKETVYKPFQQYPEVTIERAGEDEFVLTCDRTLKSKLVINSPLDPVYKIKGVKASKSERESKSQFSVRCLGASEGFDPTQPANGFLFRFKGKWMLWDCPAFLHRHLEKIGLNLEKIDAVFISHVHEDHLDIMESIGQNKKIELYTSPEIYHCMLLKLMAILECTYQKAQEYYNYHPIYANKPFNLFGASLEVFYSSHAIPALGLKLQVENGAKTSSVFLSGDTLSRRMLDTLNKSGVYSKARYAELIDSLPENPCHDISFVDAGSGAIHGDPEDYMDNPCKIVYMHTGKKLANIPSNHLLLKAGQYFVIHK
ncbi:MBL fold metallo-hydrolase [bacterium]|nr:MBL fold metallo-hydrolase [bacterium]